jgi:hypothetical protein
VNFQRFRVFTLDQANATLAVVEDLTRTTRDRLRRLETEYGGEMPPEEIERESRLVIDEWARLILELGAQPKGIFTVDFRSPDPNVLWCWAPGEREITHRHYSWESFKDRVGVNEGLNDWPSRN